MKYSRLSIAATIIALVVIVSFVFSVPHTRDIGETLPLSTFKSVPPVSLRDSFKKGVHTIIGSVEAPHACTAVTARAALLDASGTSSILVELSLSEDVGVCLQVPTMMNFTATVSAPVHLPITASVNGILATTTVL